MGKIMVILPQHREGNECTFRILSHIQSPLGSCSEMSALVPKALMDTTRHFGSCPVEIKICALNSLHSLSKQRTAYDPPPHHSSPCDQESRSLTLGGWPVFVGAA